MTDESLPAERTIELTLLLIALPPALATHPERLRRHRVKTNEGRPLLVRDFAVGEAADAETVTVEECCDLLDLQSARPGDGVSVQAPIFPELELLVALIDPKRPVLERVGALTGQTRAEVVEHFVRAGVDPVGRRVLGRPWICGPDEPGARHCWIGSEAGDTSCDLQAADARLLDPQAGDTLYVADVMRALSTALDPLATGAGSTDGGSLLMRALRGVFGRHAPDPVVHPVYGLPVADIDRLRALMVPVRTPPGLEDAGLGPLRQLYPQSDAVLYLDVAGAEAEALWIRLDACAPASGYRPVVLGPLDGSTTRARLVWDDPRSLASCCYPHPNHSPAAARAAMADIDVGRHLADGGNAAYPDVEPDRSPGAGEVDPKVHLSAVHDWRGAPHPRVRLALVRAEAAWEALLWLPVGGEAAPTLALAAAVARHWEATFGLRVAAVHGGSIEWALPDPPLDAQTAAALAAEHFNFAPEGLGTTNLADRAATIARSRFLYGWWD